MTEQILPFPDVTFHGPALVAGVDVGVWNVYCPACSEQAGEWVTMCRNGGTIPWPPLTVADESYKRTIDRQRKGKKVTDPTVRIGHRHPDTAQAAARKATLRAGTQRARVFDLICSFGDNGLTDDEIERMLSLTHQSASACRNSLMRDGYLVDSGKRRKNERDNQQIVWVAPRDLRV